MDMTPIFAVWAGLFLDAESVPPEDLQPWINDALDELEFLTVGPTGQRPATLKLKAIIGKGPSTSGYGALRSSYGYPDPFNITYVEIGNEDWLPPNATESYVGEPPSAVAMTRPLNTAVAYRFNMFADAIKSRYPQITIISSVAISSFPTPPEAGTIQDFHDYLDADTMVSKFDGYDNAPRTYPVLVGEYGAVRDASHTGNDQLNDPTLQSATSEAVYFLGLERNADLILGISHGALIKSLHDEPDAVAYMKHSPTEIVFSYSYYVAKLFWNYYGSETVAVTSETPYGPLYWAGTKNQDGTYFIKVVNYDGEESTPIRIMIPGKTAAAKLVTVSGPSALSTNTLGNITSVWSESTVQSRGNGEYRFTLTGSYVSAALIV